MNTSKLQKLVDESKFTKAQIAQKCGFTRMTLDNILHGGDAKISTIEMLAHILGTTIGYLFDEQEDPINPAMGNTNDANDADINVLRAELLLLQGENRVLREQLGLPARKETATRTA